MIYLFFVLFCVLALNSHASVIVRPPRNRPLWVLETAPSGARTGSDSHGLLYDAAGLEKAAPQYQPSTRHGSVRAIYTTGAEVISAILRADANRRGSTGRFTSSSHRTASRNMQSDLSLGKENISPGSRPFSKNSQLPASNLSEENQRKGFGLTGDTCFTKQDCLGNRVCVAKYGACRGRSNCNCIPPSPAICFSTSDCVSGEVCVATDNDPDHICVSERYAIQIGVAKDDVPLASTSPTMVLIPVESTPDSELVGGLTADPCRVSGDCRDERTCISLDTQTKCENPGSCVCFPRPVIRCEYSEECPEGEKCASSKEAENICLSSAFVEENTDVFESEPVPSMEAYLTPTEECMPNGDETNISKGQTTFDIFPRGLTGDYCVTAKDCRGRRSCVNLKASCSEKGGCICSPSLPKACTDSADCVARWRCVKLFSERYCMSKVVILRSSLQERVVDSRPT